VYCGWKGPWNRSTSGGLISQPLGHIPYKSGGLIGSRVGRVDISRDSKISRVSRGVGQVGLRGFVRVIIFSVLDAVI
jgi:hypothetical protein